MSEVIVIASGKGGVGKTTVTANLGVGLSKLGKKVALVDGDTGLRNLDIVLGVEDRVVYNSVDVVNDFCQLENAVIRDKRFDGLYLVPAAQTKDKDAISKEQMKGLCEKLKEDFDYILIDCPTGIDHGFSVAVSGADKAFVVTTLEKSAVRDADRIVGILEEKDIKDHFLIINKINPKMVKKGQLLGIDEVIKTLNIDLIGIIPEDFSVIASTNKGEPIVIEQKSPAGRGLRNITERICGNSVPLMNIVGKRFSKK